jgi:hypothetical protein
MGTYEGMPYLLSELLEGDTLRENLRRGPVPLRKVHWDADILPLRDEAGKRFEFYVRRCRLIGETPIDT